MLKQIYAHCAINNLNPLSVPVARKGIFETFIPVLLIRFHNYFPEEIKHIPYKLLFLRHVKGWLLGKDFAPRYTAN